jgi:hypothetical protein
MAWCKIRIGLQINKSVILAVNLIEARGRAFIWQSRVTVFGCINGEPAGPLEVV